MAIYYKKGAYWIDYYCRGRRFRERIGPSKRLAEQVLAKRKLEIAEDKFLDKRKETKVQFKALVGQYLAHTKDIKKSHRRDKNSANHLCEFFKNSLISTITPKSIEQYRLTRKRSRNRQGNHPKPATINRELAFLKRVFSWAIENEIITANPAKHVKLERENNVRDRVLSKDEFNSLLQFTDVDFQPVFMTAYFTGMRLSEILNLKWAKVDMKNGFIKLEPENTKTGEGRLVPLHPEVIESLKGIVRAIHSPYVFTRSNGKRIKEVRYALKSACQKAGIEGFRFHDFRHTAVTNWIRQGHDYFKIMAATGHKTTTVFQRYNTVSKDDLKTLVKQKTDGEMERTQENVLEAQ